MARFCYTLNHMTLIRKMRLSVILVLIFALSCILVSCNSPVDFSNVNMVWSESEYTMTVDDEIVLSDILIADISIDELAITSSDITIVDIFAGKLIAKSAGVATITARYGDESEVVTVSVGAKTIYASDILAEDFDMIVGESVLLYTIYDIVPSNADVSIIVSDISDNLLMIDDTVVAKRAGLGHIELSVRTSATTKISIVVNVNVARREIAIDASLTTIEGDDIGYIYENFEYLVTLYDFADYDLSKIVVSDNMVINRGEAVGDDIVLYVVLQVSGDYVISYADEYVSGSVVITNDYIHRDVSSYTFCLADFNGTYNVVGSDYTFYIGVDGVANPFATTADIVAMYDGVEIDDISIAISDTEAFKLVGTTLEVKGEGSAFITISIAGYSCDISICATRSMIEDYEISYPSSHNLADGNEITIEIIKDYDYNFLPEVEINLDCCGVDVSGLTITVRDFSLDSIIGNVVIGDITRNFEIELCHYYIDDVDVTMNMIEVGEHIVVDFAGWYVFEFDYYYLGTEVVIADDSPLTAIYKSDEKEGIMEILHNIRMFISSDTTLEIVDEYSNILVKIDIVVKNII